MHEPPRSREGSASGAVSDVCPVRSPACTVNTLRVKVIGAEQDSDSAAGCGPGRARRRTHILHRLAEPSSAPADAHKARDDGEWLEVSWRDVTLLEDETIESHEDLALARTLPSISLWELGIEVSSIYKGEQTAADTPAAPVDTTASTLRMRPCRDAPRTRGWQMWSVQPPVIAFVAAAMFCVLSVYAVGLLAP